MSWGRRGAGRGGAKRAGGGAGRGLAGRVAWVGARPRHFDPLHASFRAQAKYRARLRREKAAVEDCHVQVRLNPRARLASQLGARAVAQGVRARRGGRGGGAWERRRHFLDMALRTSTRIGQDWAFVPGAAGTTPAGTLASCPAQVRHDLEVARREHAVLTADYQTLEKVGML